MRKRAVLFDLGNTLVHYFHSAEFPPILEAGLAEVKAVLLQHGLPSVHDEVVAKRTSAENHEAPDYRVRDLEGRLVRIFGLDDSTASPELLAEMSACFLAPIFRISRLYDDTHETLELLRKAGIRTCIVSNTTWGSPAEPWREEVARHGIMDRVDEVVFCRDVGWRKPARAIFDHALERLGVRPEDSLFVGDSMKWDVAGARAAGMDAVLIDTDHLHTYQEIRHIHSPQEVPGIIGL